jgi:uncharacterized membrane protein YbhN (UPF0104 family)
VAFIILLLRLPTSKEIQLAHLDLRWLGLCMLLAILQLLLEAFVWQWLLANQRIRYAYPRTALAYLASQYLGLVTPGHVGELLAAGYISMDTGITFGYALSSVIMKKLLAWTVIVSFGLWSLPLLTAVPFLQGVQRIAWTAVVVLAAFLAGIGLWVVSFRRLTRKWQKLSPWKIDMTEFWSGMRALSSVHLAVPLSITTLSFSLLFLQYDVVLRSLGLSLSILVIGKIVALSRIAARLVPFSVVGFGSKDAAVIVLLTQQGIPLATAGMAAILFLVCSYLPTLLLSGLSWWIKPLIVRRIHAERSSTPFK